MFRVVSRSPAFAVLLLCLLLMGQAMLVDAEARSARQAFVDSGPVVTQISLQQTGDTASLVIDLSEEVPAHVSAMLDPRRLLLDFGGVRFHAPSVRIAERDGLVREIRFGAFMAGQGRIVLDLGPVSYTHLTLPTKRIV